jgi:phosphonate transport system substrate-binding protein
MTRLHDRCGRTVAGTAVVLFIALGLFVASRRAVADPGGMVPLRTCPLVVGMPRQAFTNLNEADAEAAYRAFMIAAGRKRGYDLKPELTVFDTVAELAAAVRDGSVNVATMTSWQLLDTDLDNTVDLAFVPMSAGHATRRLVLLVREDSGAKSIADLSGRSVLVLRDAKVNLASIWLDTIAFEAGVGSAESFFGSIEVVSRPNTAVLPVFFGRADACVVDEESLAVACELNPQLRSKLATIAQSAPLLDSLVCLNRIGWLSEEYREDLRQTLSELHLEPSGRQILTLFHIDRLVPFKREMLDTVTELHRRHERLLAAHGANAAGARPAATDRASP